MSWGALVPTNDYVPESVDIYVTQGMFLYKTTLTCHLHSAVRNGGFIRKAYNEMHLDPRAWIPSSQ